MAFNPMMMSPVVLPSESSCATSPLIFRLVSHAYRAISFLQPSYALPVVSELPTPVQTHPTLCAQPPKASSSPTELLRSQRSWSMNVHYNKPPHAVRRKHVTFPPNPTPASRKRSLGRSSILLPLKPGSTTLRRKRRRHSATSIVVMKSKPTYSPRVVRTARTLPAASIRSCPSTPLLGPRQSQCPNTITIPLRPVGQSVSCPIIPIAYESSCTSKSSSPEPMSSASSSSGDSDNDYLDNWLEGVMSSIPIVETEDPKRATTQTLYELRSRAVRIVTPESDLGPPVTTTAGRSKRRGRARDLKES